MLMVSVPLKAAGLGEVVGSALEYRVVFVFQASAVRTCTCGISALKNVSGRTLIE